MPISNQSETIDPRILRLIGLEDVFDLDYDTYFTLLREALVKSNMPGKSIPAEEFKLLKDELKRVRPKRNDGRFGVKKKRISTASFNISNIKGLIGGTTSSLLPPVSALSRSPMSGGLESGISEIKEVMVSILETLKLQKKTDKDTADYERRKVEQEKRGLAESKLEKRFEGIKKVAENIIKPVKSLLNRIFEFIGTVLLGRIVYKLIEWLGDPKNADKVKSLIRFFSDNWPKLLSLYIIFGTSFGKFARGLISLVIKGTAALVKATAGLAAKVIGGRVGGRLGKVAGFLGGGKGKLLVAGVEAVATIGGTLALSKGLENFGGIGDGNKETKSQNFAGGGYVRPRFPAFSGGGFNFKGMMGNMFGPLGMLLGDVFGGSNGYVSGEKGVDKIPAMLSDGEFVMSRGAVQKYGVDTLEAMNSAGGGTNKPKIMSGTTYAAGGGMIGKRYGSTKEKSKMDTPYLKLSPLEIKFATRARQRGITDPIELKAFLSQVKHESGGNFGKPQREKYNSSPNDPPGKPGYEYFRGYTGMNGNRNADDAYTYIGRGYLQITGRSNYADIGKRIGKDLVNNPQLLMDSNIALDASIEYWKSRVRPNVKNWNNVFEVSKAVNKPSALSPSEIVGMEDRTKTFQAYNTIPNQTLSSLTKPKQIQPKRSPNLIERISSLFIPKAFASENNPIKKTSNQIQTSPPNTPRANIAKTRPSLKTINPRPSSSSRSRSIPMSGGMGNSAGGYNTGRSSSALQIPSFSAQNPRSNNAKAKTLGVRG